MALGKIPLLRTRDFTMQLVLVLLLSNKAFVQKKNVSIKVMRSGDIKSRKHMSN
jgi:hypothetical protein